MIEIAQALFTWYNLIYTLPLLLVALYLVLHLLGSEFGAGVEPTIGDIAFGDDDLQPAGARWWMSLQRFIHIGDLPFMFLVGSLCISWGILGNTVNHAILQSTGYFVWYLLPLSMAVTLFGSIVITKGITELLVLLFPTAEHPATSLDELVGGTAIVLSGHVDALQGRARAKDADGNAITIFCRTQAGEMLRQGDEVVLVDYHPDARTFDVEKLDVM